MRTNSVENGLGVWVMPDIRPWVLTRHDVLRSSSVVYRILYHFLATLARLAVRSGRSKDLEIIVLRHQLTVLRRQDDQPQLNNSDRSLWVPDIRSWTPTRRDVRHRDCKRLAWVLRN